MQQKVYLLCLLWRPKNTLRNRHFRHCSKISRPPPEVTLRNLETSKMIYLLEYQVLGIFIKSVKSYSGLEKGCLEGCDVQQKGSGVVGMATWW